MSAPRVVLWTRQDVGIYRNPKILRLLASEGGCEAYTAWSLGIGYSGENHLGGLIPREALLFVHATDMAVKLLEREGFWEPCPQGWIIHDWDDHNPGLSYEQSTVETEEEETAAERKERLSARGRKAANARWHPDAEQ